MHNIPSCVTILGQPRIQESLSKTRRYCPVLVTGCIVLCFASPNFHVVSMLPWQIPKTEVTQSHVSFRKMALMGRDAKWG